MQHKKYQRKYKFSLVFGPTLWGHHTNRGFSNYNKGSPKTADIYLSVPLLWSFLFDLALSSVLKLFICPNMDFLSLS